MADLPHPTIVELTSRIVSAFVRNNSVPPTLVPTLMSDVHASLQRLTHGNDQQDVAPEPLQPAVPIRKSVTDDYIICLDNGRKLKSLRRHLSTLGMTPDQYRAKWGLPANYPMVAPGYSAARSSLAKRTGLGSLRKKGAEQVPEPAPMAMLEPERKAKAKRTRKKAT